MADSKPDIVEEERLLQQAIKKTGRPIVYSLCESVAQSSIQLHIQQQDWLLAWA